LVFGIRPIFNHTLFFVSCTIFVRFVIFVVNILHS
jgi:hypothetical protein